MNVIEENITRINNKLQQLLKNYAALQKENEQLSVSLSIAKTQKLSDAEKISQLEQQIGILKSAAGHMSEAEKKVFEKNINQYIKEIDKCIGLLSE